MFVNLNLMTCLTEISEMLKNKTYEVSPYTESVITERGKKRKINKLPYFPDRIIQWAIVLQINSIFEKNLCYHTCAGIDGRGTGRASKLLRSYLHKDPQGTKYCCQIDVHHFYESIDRNILKNKIRTKIKDKDLLWLLDLIIDSPPGDKGIPIGSYLSIKFANFYLSSLDHWLKEVKKVCYVIRYNDDIVLLHHSKNFLHKIRKEIERYLNQKLHLQLKENWQIYPVKNRGVDFVGYRHFPDYVLLRKRILKNFKKVAKSIIEKRSENITKHDEASFFSYKGWIIRCNSFRLKQKYFYPILNKIKSKKLKKTLIKKQVSIGEKRRK